MSQLPRNGALRVNHERAKRAPSGTTHCCMTIRMNRQVEKTVSYISMSASIRAVKQILLSTAEVKAYNEAGQGKRCRVILDSGSQPNFITEFMTKKLGLKTKRVSINIMGCNQLTSRASLQCNVRIASRDNEFQTLVTCYVLKKITEKLPAYPIDTTDWHMPDNISLAQGRSDRGAEGAGHPDGKPRDRREAP